MEIQSKPGVYQIQSKVTGEVILINIAQNCYAKIELHKSILSGGLQPNAKLRSFVTRDGADSIEFIVVEYCESAELLDKLAEHTNEPTEVTKAGPVKETKPPVIEPVKEPKQAEKPPVEQPKAKLPVQAPAAKVTSGNPAKPIIQMDMEGTLVKDWPSASAAAKELGYNKSHIAAACRGTRKSVEGFTWKYKV